MVGRLRGYDTSHQSTSAVLEHDLQRVDPKGSALLPSLAVFIACTLLLFLSELWFSHSPLSLRLCAWSRLRRSLLFNLIKIGTVCKAAMPTCFLFMLGLGRLRLGLCISFNASRSSAVHSLSASGQSLGKSNNGSLTIPQTSIADSRITHSFGKYLPRYFSQNCFSLCTVTFILAADCPTILFTVQVTDPLCATKHIHEQHTSFG